MKQLGELFKQRREERKLSRAAIAHEMGNALGERVDQSYIASIERGAFARPDRARLVWLATYLEVSVDEALRAAGYPTEDGDQVAALYEHLPLDIRDAMRDLDAIPTDKREEVLEVIRRIVRLYVDKRPESDQA